MKRLKLPADFQQTLSDLLKVKPPPKPEKKSKARKAATGRKKR